MIYADLTFLFNGCVDFLLLWLTAGIRKQRPSILRLILASVLGGVYSVCYLWPTFRVAYYIPIKIIVSIFMTWIAFGLSSFTAFVRNLFTFYLVCFVFGGAILGLHYAAGSYDLALGRLGGPISWLLILCGFPAVWLYVKHTFASLEERFFVNNYLTDVKIKIGDYEICCVGLIDTGNQLRDPVSRAPVIVVEQRQLAKLLPVDLDISNLEQLSEKLPVQLMKCIRFIPYKVAGDRRQMMLAFKFDKAQILFGKKWNKISSGLIGIETGSLSSDGTYQAILHPSCLSVAV